MTGDPPTGQPVTFPFGQDFVWWNTAGVLTAVLGGRRPNPVSPVVDPVRRAFCADEVMLAAHIAIDIPHLPRYGRLATIARVKRCTPVETPTGRVYHVGVSLEEGLSAREQERLIQSVFELQRSYLQRGLRMPCLNHTACAKSSQRHLRGRAERKEKVEQHGGTGRESRRFDAERI